MAGVIATIPKFQFSANGVPMVGGTLETYIAGSTTPATTWQDSALTIANTNPISLDARGECVLWLDPAVVYKFVLKNAQGVIQWTQDNISNPAALANSLRADLAAATGASLVGFQSPDTGAVATTVQDQLRKSQSTNASLDVIATVATATDKPRNVVAVDGFLHVINQASTGTLQSTYQIFDITADVTPVLISTTNVGALSDDYRALVVRGQRAYVAAITGGIKVYDISNRAVPTLLSTIAVSSGGVHALNLCGGVLFATLYQAGVIEAYDVSTDTPTLISSVGLGANSPMGSFISGDYLYCCTNNATVTFFAVNIRNPKAMTTTAFVLPAAAISGRNVYVSGRYAYVACIGSDTVEILDIATPTAPTWVAKISVPGPTGNCHWVRGIGKYLIVGCGATALYDASSPTEPTFIKSISAVGTSFDFWGDRLMIGDYAANAIKVARCAFPATTMQMGGAMALDALRVKEQFSDHIFGDSIDFDKIGARDIRTSEYSASGQSGIRVYATLNQTIVAATATVVQFANTTYDKQTEWSTEAHAFTAKSDGIYMVSCSLLTDSSYAINNFGQMDVLLNGTAYSMIGWVTPLTVATNRQVNGTCLVKMNKGQNIQIRWFSNLATTFSASSTNTWLSVQKVA